jgi:hypothetical protein
MSEERPGEPALELTEDDVPLEEIDVAVEELIDLYGGELTASRERARDFTLPLRRGMISSGGVQCTVSWAPEGVVTLICDRNVDAPKLQRVLLLIAGVVGSVLFMLWPFFPSERGYGTLAWMGGVMAFAVYLMTLRKTSGGIANDFLRRLVARQRS